MGWVREGCPHVTLEIFFYFILLNSPLWSISKGIWRGAYINFYSCICSLRRTDLSVSYYYLNLVLVWENKRFFLNLYEKKVSLQNLPYAVNNYKWINLNEQTFTAFLFYHVFSLIYKEQAFFLWHCYIYHYNFQQSHFFCLKPKMILKCCYPILQTWAIF